MLFYIKSGGKRLLFILFVFKIIGCFILYGIIENHLEIRRYREIISKYVFNSKNEVSLATKEVDKKEEIESIRYVNIHEQIVLNWTEEKVVFYKVTDVGYGNRIYSMLSAFLAAVISDSALLIDWPSIDNYIDSPLVDVFSMYTDNSFLDLNQKSPKICKINTSTKNTWSFNKHLNFLQALNIPRNCNRYYVSDMTPYFFDLAANLKHAEKLAKYGFVRSDTVKKAQKNLKDKHATKAQKLDSLFRIGFEFAGHVLNNYWLLKPNVNEKINNFIKQKFSGDFIIGLQMRFEYLDQEDIQTFVNCALKIEKDNRAYIGNRKARWFISTDRKDRIQNLIRQYGNKIFVGNGKIGHVAFAGGTYERTLLDIELLSYSNVTVLTGGSTFGFIGSLKSQKIPYFVEGKRSSNECKLLDFHAPARRPAGFSVF